MTPVLSRLLVVLIVLGAATAAARADAPPGPSTVKDGAGLFDPGAIAQADAQVRAIRKTFGLDVFVETIGRLPPEERKWFLFWDRRRVVRYLNAQAQHRADAEGVHGIYIIICGGRERRWWRTNERDVQVLVWPASEAAKFSAHDCEQVRLVLARGLYEGHYDQALLAAVRQIQATLEARAAGRDTDADAAISPALVAALVGGTLGLSLLLALIRRRLRRSDHAALATARAMERPVLLANQFGFPAGHWIYDRLVRDLPRPPAAIAPEPGAPAPVSHEESEPPARQPVDEGQENAPV